MRNYLKMTASMIRTFKNKLKKVRICQETESYNWGNYNKLK